MKPIFEIVMRAKQVTLTDGDPTGITQLMVRVEGYERNQAVLLAEQMYPDFSIYYVIAGPRNEVRD